MIEKMIKNKDLMNKKEYFKYLKDIINTYSKEELSKFHFVKLLANVSYYHLSLDSKKEIIALLDERNKIDYLERVNSSYNFLEYVEDDYKVSYSKNIQKATVDKSKISPDRITVFEVLSILKEISSELREDDMYAVRLMFRSAPFMGIYTNKDSFKDLRLFSDLNTMDRNSNEYVKTSDRVKEILTILVKKLEEKGIYDYSDFLENQEVYSFINNISVRFKEFEKPTRENLLDIINLNPFREDIWDRSDIKILKDIFYKKVNGAEFNDLINELENDGFITIKRTSSLRVRQIHIKGSKKEMTLLENFESHGKLKKEDPNNDIYSFIDFDVFDTIKVLLVKENNQYFLNIHYGDLNSTRRMFSDVCQWDNFVDSLEQKIREKQSLISEFLNTEFTMTEFSFVQFDSGYFKLVIEFK